MPLHGRRTHVLVCAGTRVDHYSYHTVNRNLSPPLLPRQLTPKEKEVSDYVMEKFFKPLNDSGKQHWEGVEVREFWNTIGTKADELIAKRYPDFRSTLSPLAPP
jgi:hypothetical protein